MQEWCADDGDDGVLTIWGSKRRDARIRSLACRGSGMTGAMELQLDASTRELHQVDLFLHDLVAAAVRKSAGEGTQSGGWDDQDTKWYIAAMPKLATVTLCGRDYTRVVARVLLVHEAAIMARRGNIDREGRGGGSCA